MPARLDTPHGTAAAILLGVVAALALMLAPPPHAAGQQHTSNPSAYAGVDANDVILLHGVNTVLTLAATSSAASNLTAESRNEAGDAFATYTVALYTGNSKITTDSGGWQITFDAPSADIAPTQWRLSYAGQHTAWFMLPAQTSSARLPDLHPALRALGIARGRYESFDPGAGADPNAIVQQPPSEFLISRLKGTTGGLAEPLPGGPYTAIFLVPMLFAGISLTYTKNPSTLLIIIGSSMALTCWLVEASPFAFILCALFGGSGALLALQFGFGRKFGGGK